jgi:N-dimethylarginine dimethylaminohydrolase
MCSASCYHGEESSHDPSSAFYRGKQKPNPKSLIKEQNTYFDILKKYDAKILLATPTEGAFDQVFTRDPLFVIGDILFLSNMKESVRKIERYGLQSLLSSVSSDIIEVPKNIVLEGGDVLVHGKDIFVGQSMRTTIDAVHFLKKTLGNKYRVHSIVLEKNRQYNTRLLHLDVAFAILSPRYALVYGEGIEKESLKIIKKFFEPILIDAAEQWTLGANVFCVDNNVVVMQSQHDRIKKELLDRGFIIEAVNMSETSKRGGALRCTTCPLERE